MHAILGIDQKGEPIWWNEKLVSSPHFMLSGKTGSGKTHFLRRLITSLVRSSKTPPRVHVLDVHDDIHLRGESCVLFSQAMGHGLNVLDVDPCPHTGGPKRAINDLIEVMEKTSSFKLGARQLPVFRNLLLQLYERNGFFSDNPNSWKITESDLQRKFPKKVPTLQDALRFARYKLNEIERGLNGKASSAITALSKLQKKKSRILRGTSKDGLADIEEKIAEIKADMISEFTAFTEQSELGTEWESAVMYDDPNILKAVIDRLSNLEEMKVLSGNSAPFDPNATIWRYNLKSLTIDQSKLFVNTLLKRLFTHAVRNGETTYIRDIVVVDECKRYTEDEDNNILNRICLEARKFGLMLIPSSQSHAHYTPDMLKSAGTSVVLQQDPLDYQYLAKNALLSKDQLESIKPRKSAMVKISTTTAQATGYSKTEIDDSVIEQSIRSYKERFHNTQKPNHAGAQQSKAPQVNTQATHVGANNVEVKVKADTQPKSEPAANNQAGGVDLLDTL